MTFGKYFFTLTLLGLSANLASAQQSTPVHDHSKHSTRAKTILPGTYKEIKGDHAVGSTSAPITMIVYASVTCPHCATWFEETWPSVKSNYIDTNKLRLVFREFPTQPAQIAFAGFLLANCAPEKDYFPLIEHLMKEQSNTNTAVQNGKGLETFLAIAKRAGKNNEAEMNACFDSAAGMEKIQKSHSLANSADIHGVPRFIVNGTIFEGDSSYSKLSKHFDSMLAKSVTPIPKP